MSTSYVCRAGVGLLMSLVGTAAAQPALVTSPAVVEPGATTIIDASTGNSISLATAQITVRNTTLTINGRHNIASLTLENSGVLTHSAATVFDYSGGAGTDVVYGMHLVVSGNVIINANTRIDVNSRGFASEMGPGAGQGGISYQVSAGGGHGGNGGGGASNYTPTAGGGTYGSVASPVTYGSGGGSDDNGLGGAGGGAVTLTIHGSLTHAGTIRANGSISVGQHAGGGAGGSVCVTAQSITGSGAFEATGGNANTFYSGGGGGGRIAIISASETPGTLTLNASGGAGLNRGGAGSIYTRVGGGISTTTYDNKGFNNVRTDLAADRSFGNLVITGRAMLSHPQGETDFQVTTTGNVTIDPNSGIDVSGRGFISDVGPGAGAGGTNNEVAAGGGHGGNGGEGSSNFTYTAGGSTYGSVASPVTFGSGGGRDDNALGTAGGGAVKLTIAGSFSHAGIIRANGVNTSTGEVGAGAGGSVWVNAHAISGIGAFEATGGNANTFYAGGGGGGRIAIITTNELPGSLTFNSSGGAGLNRGGAGSVYTRAGDGISTTTYDNKGFNNVRTDLAEDRIFGNLVITGRAMLSHPKGESGFEVTTTGNVTIDANSGIDVSGRGFASDVGDGAGQGGASNEVAAGGGHGGNGGGGSSSFTPTAGGGTYGSLASPVTFGSGGGRDDVSLGGGGGGAVKLTINGSFIHAGFIRANGANSEGQHAGSGAGGSVWVITQSISGNGAIDAAGGNANTFYSGGGGGGRISLISDSDIPSALTFNASGGAGLNRGGAGSVYTRVGEGISTTTYDNKGFNNVRTDLADDRTFGNLVITGRAVITHKALEDDVRVDVTNNLVIDADSGIDLLGRGFASDTGPGAGTGGVIYQVAAGGGFGGRGGNGSAAFGSPAGGIANGDPSSPLGFGSGGGRDNSSLGGAGGGSIQLVVGVTATVNGFIRSHGAPRGGNEAGGGSGGGLWVQAGTLEGSGTISSRGGDGVSTYSGGGGGGRIGIYSCNLTMPLANITALGGAGWQAGQPGTIYYGSSSITFSEQPVSADYDGGALIQLGVVASSNSTVTYRWRKRGSDGNFVELQDNAIYSGTDSSTLFISNAGCQDGGEYDCLACADCGCMPSAAATIYVNATGDYNLDGGVDGSDVDAFFFDWSAGNAGADVNFDGGVDGADVEFFFINWSAGC